MSRRHRSNQRSSKHKQAALEPDFRADGRAIKDNVHARARKDHNGGKKVRSHTDAAKSSRPRRHNNKYIRRSLDKDTDGDCSMLPTPPPSPHPTPGVRAPSKQEIGRRKRYAHERLPQLLPDRDKPEQPGDAAKNYRFRHQVLSLLDQQRAAVESWAESVGVGGPAEPMDWQPEQERVVYFARVPAEDGCYADRWRIGEQKELAPAHQVLGPWTCGRWLDGSMMWGTPAVGLAFLEEIE